MKPGRLLLLACALGAASLGVTVTPSVAATNECRGLNPCVPVAGPWVIVPAAQSVPRPRARYQLTCPQGFVVGGVDAELSDRAIDLAFLGASGSPVGPGVTTSRTILFVAAYVGTAPQAPTFRPHAGCVPATGGGQRTPTGLAAVSPPGQPTVRRVVTTRVRSTKRIVAACHTGERLVDWYVSRGLATTSPPPAALVAGLTASGRAVGERVAAVARARRGAGIVQVGAVCAGGA